ncbi:MAG: S1 RNA-binding domain-containing protein [Thermoguttaceae bacterium]|nr:S1 RNA-binding domain-containing protein [Thermoguttaceae bacterium]
MTSEKNPAENNLQDQSLAPQSAASSDDAKQGEPLATYEQVNADAPVTTVQMIAERLAKKRAENAADGAQASSSPLAGKLQESRRQPREERAPRPGRGPRGSRGRRGDDAADDESPKKEARGPRRPVNTVPLPNRRVKTDEEEAELAALFEGQQMSDLIAGTNAVASQEIYEEHTKVYAKIVSIQKDFAFVDIGARDQGMIPLKQFSEEEPAKVGDVVEAVVVRYNKEDGLYDVSLPLAAAEVGDWSSLSKGMVVNVKVTGANTGGLECKVGNLPAFLPISQIDIVRVENPEQYVDETWRCVITDVNPARRNIVVSRRKLIEEENRSKRDELLAELDAGQVRDGVVRNMIDQGVFVDLGGVDGFIPVSQLSWGRVNHPKDVVQLGERIKVTVTRVDRDKNRISLSFKDSAADPWNLVHEKLAEGDQTRGKVTRITDFGAFVEIFPGVEGLVHISEIAYQRVENVADALSVGDYVDVKILSIDEAKRKMSLSIKQTTEDPRPARRAAREAERQAKMTEEEKKAEAERKEKEEKENAEWDAKIEEAKKKLPKSGLKGGVASQGEGAKFGLKWG